MLFFSVRFLSLFKVNIDNCLFENNQAFFIKNNESGSAIYLDTSQRVEIRNSVFIVKNKKIINC